MRIDRLDLIAYGPFTGKTLDLSDGNSGLHMIYGDNEAGKSTSLRALIAWLFGIAPRTRDNFLHANPQLRIGGKLRRSDGSTVEFIRRKGVKGTLLKYEADVPLDDDILSPFMPGGIDENIFTKLWGIDHDRLIAGGRELLAQSGDLGQALFSAAVGTASLREVLVDLQSNAEAIFKPRASKTALNQAIANFKESQKKIKDSSLPVSEWKKMRKNESDTLAAITRVEKEIEARSREKSRLERLNRIMGPLAERRAVMARIAELGQVLLLPETFEEDRKAASEALQRAMEKKQRAAAKLSRLVEEYESLSVRTDLLENEAVILKIHKELGAYETRAKDRPQQDGKRRLLRNEAQTLLKGVRPDLDLDQADGLRPLLNNKRWIAELAQKHRLLAQKKENAEAVLKDIEDEQADLQSKLIVKPEPRIDLDELKATIAEVNKAGNVEQRLAEVRKRASEERVACENELARLGRYTGTVSALLQVAMPEPETLDIFEKENDELSQRMRDLQHRQQDVEGQLKQTGQGLQTLLLSGDVPTIVELEASRNDRDCLWQGIKRKYIETDGTDAIIPGYPLDADLPEIYERKVKGADDLADRIRLAADQVVKRADLEARIAELKSLREDTSRLILEVKTSRQNYQDRWSAVWEPLAIDAGTPREMKQWLVRVDKLIAGAMSANAVAREAQSLAGECERLKETVYAQIVKLDPSIDSQTMSLGAMVAFCEQRIREEDEIRQQQRQIAQSLNESNIRLKRVRDELNTIGTDQSNWSREWHQAIEGLGLKADVRPEHATETFERLVAFFEKFDGSEDLRKRIYGMDQASAAFEEQVFRFADSIAFKREGQGAAAVAAQLHHELNSAREARASLENIETQIREIKEEIDDDGITIHTSMNQLAALKVQARVETDDDLIRAGETSRHKRELQKELDRLEQELNRTGDGLSIEALEEESGQSDLDSIDGLLEKVSLELKDLQAERDRLRDERQTLLDAIRARDGSAAAAEASEEAEEHLASMVASAEQYLRFQIAALILEQRVEDYRKKNQAPVLARAGELFSRLTLGSYASLRDELDRDGKPVLLGVRPDDREVPIEGMSDGSRDQLYLGLRIATLEQHLVKGEPMPFIVDDILIGFDDNRTRVCLEVLGELAASTQVLLFTHHRRDLEMAGAIDAPAGVYTHELN